MPFSRCLRKGCPALLLSMLVLIFVVAGDAFAASGSGSPLLEATPLDAPDFYRINSYAQGLAGEFPASQGGAAPWQTAPEWSDYRDWLDGSWRSITHLRLAPMQTWATTALADLWSRSDKVFYPFSGPDFLYVNTLFPQAKVVVLGGLEPVGTMPDLAALQQQGQLGPYLQQVKTSLFTILAASFFETKDMKAEFGNPLVNGLMPALAVFLAREGYTIDSLLYVSLGHDGTLHPHESAGASGVQITYFHGDRNDSRVLIYLQANLDNDALRENPGFLRLLQRLGPGNTYLKAASYLLHTDDFSSIRNGILDNSVGVVEDDSGIPLRDFKPSLWNVIPYGNYTGPLPVFKEYNQADLAEFYAMNPHAALPFGSGYKFNPAISSLLVAKKK